MKRRVSQPSATAATAAGTAEMTAPKRRSRADRAAGKHFMALLRAGADTRTKKVKRIRQSVRTRSYENELKLSVAMDRMARDLAL